MRVSVRVDGQKEASARISDVGLRARRPEPALRSPTVKLILQQGQRRRFSHTRGWPRVTEQWAKRKRRQGLDPRTMRASGALEGILTNAGPDTRFDAFNMTLRWGLKWRSVAFYAADQAKNHRRRAVVIDRPARAAIAEHVGDYIAGGDAG